MESVANLGAMSHHITDGAAQAPYKVVHFENGDHGKGYLQLKVQGTLIAGIAVLFHLIYPWVPTGANVNITVAHDCLREERRIRVKRGLPLTSHHFEHVDGGSENWNQAFMAYFEHNVAQERIATSEVYRPNKGATHCAADGIFGTSRGFLEFTDLLTPADIRGCVWKATQLYRDKGYEVIIKDVTDSLDFWAYYGAGEGNLQVTGFGHSPAPGHLGDGYHFASIKRGPAPGSAITTF
jgi:hypothetical protein